MNNEMIMKTVRGVVTRVLEEAAFVFVDEIPPEALENPVAWKAEGVSLFFTGEHTGTFRLWAAPALASAIAANILGNDAGGELPDRKVLDALKETVNMIAGNSLTELFGDTAVFDLGIPDRADPAFLAADRVRPDGIRLVAEEGELLCIADVSKLQPEKN